MNKVSKQPAHSITVEGIQLPLIATRNLRSKRLILRWDAKQQVVKLTLPRSVSVAQGLEFAESRRNWIMQQMQASESVKFEEGASLPLWGEEYLLCHLGGRGVTVIDHHKILVTGDEAFFARRVRDFIKAETQVRMSALAKDAAAKLGVKLGKITLRETSSRWGSCTSKGDISLCWRLAFAPRAVMDYVVYHEVAHILHHNHGKAYWQTVKFLCADYEVHEKWLDKHGASLWHFG